MYDTVNNRVRLASWSLIIVCVLGFAWVIVSSITVRQATGVLDVKSTDKNASIIISQVNHQAIVIGIGSKKVRLNPGVYQVSASDKGKQANAIVTIAKAHTSTSYLNPSQEVMLPSVNDVNFQGMGSLINNGLTTIQITDLEQEFFQYKPSAQRIAINSSSVQPSPSNPASNDPFTINFNVLINSKKYKATASYASLESIQLSLYSVTDNQLLFSSGSGSSNGGD